MVSARSAAMGFNRLVDARFDALNPRTAMRELPRGAMTTREAALFVVVSSVVFVYRRVAAQPAVPGCCRRSRWRSCSGIRWPSAYTTYTQLFLGLAMAVAPVGGWIAAGGRRRRRAVAARPGHRPVGRRVRHPLRLPGRRVRSRPRPALDSRRASASPAAIRLSRVMHVGDGRRDGGALARRAICRRSTSPASRSSPCLLAYEQSLVSDDDLSQVKRAFDLNGYVGIVYFAATALSLYSDNHEVTKARRSRRIEMSCASLSSCLVVQT